MCEGTVSQSGRCRRGDMVRVNEKGRETRSLLGRICFEGGYDLLQFQPFIRLHNDKL